MPGIENNAVGNKQVVVLGSAPGGKSVGTETVLSDYAENIVSSPLSETVIEETVIEESKVETPIDDNGGEVSGEVSGEVTEQSVVEEKVEEPVIEEEKVEEPVIEESLLDQVLSSEVEPETPVSEVPLDKIDVTEPEKKTRKKKNS